MQPAATWDEAMRRASDAETWEERASWVDYAREMRLGTPKPEAPKKPKPPKKKPAGDGRDLSARPK